MRCGLDVTIINIGGLLFLYHNELCETYGLILMKPEVTFDEAVRTPWESNIVCWSKRAEALRTRIEVFPFRWQREVLKTGRNRWKEMAERGGRVHPDLLDDNLIAEIHMYVYPL